MKNILKPTWIYPIVLVVITSVVAFLNYTPQTFLSGWDTLHPEFNYSLNLYRTFFGVFREEQGLGAVAAHAHMVELVRIPFLAFFDIFLPTNMLRYAYTFAALIAGPLGMYFFLQKTIIKHKLASFLGALFYLLNLGTMQTFLVPFEMFTTLFATLPWIFLTTTLYLTKPDYKKLILFSIVTLIASQSAYASTLWFVFFLAFLVYFAPYVFFLRKKHSGIVKRFIIIITATFAINAYWLLPNIYFASSDASLVQEARVNKVFSEEAFLKNKQFGTFPDIALLKTFYFDWGIYSHKTQSFEQLTKVFQTHLGNKLVSLIGYTFALFSLTGFFYSLKRNRALAVSNITLVLFSLLFLINANPPLTHIFEFFQNNIPLFKEALRRPEDKILNIFIFQFAMFFAFANLLIIRLLKKLKRAQLISYVFAGITSAALIYYMLPIFQGNLIHPFTRVTIPSEYFQLFDTLKNEEGRIAPLPVHSPWGWIYYDWWGEEKPSFQGAGFLYFGAKPALLDRDFDRWNPHNEQYYNEMSHALYTNNLEQIKNVITKYDITHLFLDTSVIAPGTQKSTLFYPELDETVNSLIDDGLLEKEQKFGSFLSLYKVKSANESKVNSLQSVVNTNSYNSSYYRDDIYKNFGDYANLSDESSKLLFPLLNLHDNESRLNSNIIKINENSITFDVKKRPYELINTSIETASFTGNVILTLSQEEGKSMLQVSIYPIAPILENNPLLSPIQGSFAIEDLSTSLLSINSQTFTINNLIEDTPTLAGTVSLSAGKNTIALYETKGQEKTLYPLDNIPLSFSYCDSTSNLAQISSTITQDELRITKEGQGNVCVYIPLSFLEQTSTNSKLVTIEYASNPNTTITPCLAYEENNSCYFYPKSQNSGYTQTAFSVSESQTKNSKLVFKTESTSNIIHISNFALNTTLSSNESTIDKSFFEPTEINSFTSITIPRSTEPDYYFKPSTVSGSNNECVTTETDARKEVRNSSKEQSSIINRYISQNRSFCDHVSFRNLHHNTSYILSITSENVQGIPLNVCVTNHITRRCDIFAKLSSGSGIKTDYFYLPASNEQDTVGYDVNIENTGFKRVPATNDLYQISFIPIPSSLLSNIKSGEDNRIRFPGTIDSEKIKEPSNRTISTKNGPTLISLSYPFHNGFNAYKLSCSSKVSCTLKQLFPFITGKKIDDHYKAQSWKNVWITNEKDDLITIQFVPQYLQYAGFLTLLIFTSVLTIFSIMHDKNHKKQ